jgi:flagellar motor switch protein FliM
MRKILSLEEIDALFGAAHAGPQASRSAGEKKVQPCDLRRSSILTADQVRVVTALHESLARRLAQALGAYLRVSLEIALLSVEQLTYHEFVTRIPEITYLASLHVLPMDARVALQADISLVFPIVDLVLGGSGADLIEPRDLTEIEERLFDLVVRLIARDLQSIWAPVLELAIRFDQCQQYTQMHNLMPPHEKILAVSFEIRLLEARGTLNLAFPAVIADALLRKLSVRGSLPERVTSAETRRRLQERLLDSRFIAQLCLPPSPLKVRDLLALEVGDIVPLPRACGQAVHLNVAGKPMFHAFPVRHGIRKGARIERRSSIVATNGLAHANGKEYQ